MARQYEAGVNLLSGGMKDVPQPAAEHQFAANPS